MIRCTCAAVGVFVAMAGCSGPPTGTQPAPLASGQRQTDRGVFGDGARPQASKGLPDSPPEIAIFEKKGGSQGLVIAAWADGTVVFATRVDAPGTDLKLGHADSERVSRVLELCGTAGVGTKSPTLPAPDWPHRSIGAHYPGRAAVTTSWPVAMKVAAEEVDAVNACEFCAARAIALIPFDGGRGLDAPGEWIAKVERYAATGKWGE